MSKVLVLHPPVNQYIPSIGNHATYLSVIALLRRFGIDYEEHRPGNENQTAGYYDACIIPVHSQYACQVNAAYRAFTNTGKAYPILALSVAEVDANNQDCGVSAITSAIDVAGGTLLSGPGGVAVAEQRIWGVTLDPDCTSLITISGGVNDGKAVMWKREATETVAFRMYASIANQQLVPILYFLQEAGIAPSKPFKKFIDLDDISGYYGNANEQYRPAATYATDGLPELVSWLQARNTLALGGLIPMDRNDAPQGVLGTIAANPDVLPCINHPHLSATEGAWYDDVTYATAAEKEAYEDSEAALWAALGITMHKWGYNGYIYLPWNSCTRVSRLAMTRNNAKLVRTQNGATDWPFVVDLGGRTHIIEPDPEGENPEDTIKYYAYGLYNRYDWDEALWSEYVAGVTGGETGALRLFLGSFVKDASTYIYGSGWCWLEIIKDVRHDMWHPLNIPGGSDSFFFNYYEKLWDPLVALAPDYVGYATSDDWQKVAE
jgi:hypothetical protein